MILVLSSPLPVPFSRMEWVMICRWQSSSQFPRDASTSVCFPPFSDWFIVVSSIRHQLTRLHLLQMMSTSASPLDTFTHQSNHADQAERHAGPRTARDAASGRRVMMREYGSPPSASGPPDDVRTRSDRVTSVGGGRHGLLLAFVRCCVRPLKGIF